MTFCLNKNEEELLVKINSSLLLKKSGAFIELNKPEEKQALEALSSLKNQKDLEPYLESIESLIKKIGPSEHY